MQERFNRHYLIPGWNQKALRDATVIVAGVGALGNEVCRILAASGIGHLIICDDDIVEESNLSRCTLFTTADIGTSKVNAAKKALQTIAPDAMIDSRNGKFANTVGLGTIRRAMLVISCVDSYAARVQLSGRCNLVATPHIDGGTNEWGGEVRPYLDNNGGCFACFNLDKANNETVQSCSTQKYVPMGSSLSITAITGAWMSNIALRFIQGLSVTAHILKFDTATGQSTEIIQSRNPDCPLHQPLAQIKRRLSITNKATIQELIKNLPSDAVPMLWEDFSVKNPYDWNTENNPFRHRTAMLHYPASTTDLLALDPDLTLATVGIPPEEIIPYKIDNRYEYVELSV
jgi:molybdopterin/thiamine biosynthesis adenylyltransferase